MPSSAELTDGHETSANVTGTAESSDITRSSRKRVQVAASTSSPTKSSEHNTAARSPTRIKPPSKTNDASLTKSPQNSVNKKAVGKTGKLTTPKNATGSKASSKAAAQQPALSAEEITSLEADWTQKVNDDPTITLPLGFEKVRMLLHL